MKKEIKKLALSKSTISNLTDKEMNQRLGGKTALGCIPKKAAAKPKQ